MRGILPCVCICSCDNSHMHMQKFSVCALNVDARPVPLQGLFMWFKSAAYVTQILLDEWYLSTLKLMCVPGEAKIKKATCHQKSLFCLCLCNCRWHRQGSPGTPRTGPFCTRFQRQWDVHLFYQRSIPWRARWSTGSFGW